MSPRAILLIAFITCAYTQRFSLKPPLGWNTWDAYMGDISESLFMSESLWFAEHLAPYGYEYVVIDGGWDTQYTTDGYCRTVPNPDTWPSSAGGAGLKPLVDTLHSKGIKVGLHLMRGISQAAVTRNEAIFGTQYHAQDVVVKNDNCVWATDWVGLNSSHPGLVAYYDSLVTQMADWEIDLIKVDCIGFGRDQHNADIIAIANAIKRIEATRGHRIIFSLSPGEGATPQDAADMVKYTDFYRITNDLWDCWNGTRDNPGCFNWDENTVVKAVTTVFPGFQNLIAAEGLHGNSYPDGDMLPIGRVAPNRPSGLTFSQQQLLVTVWSIFKNPLMIGTQLKTMPSETFALLTNKEVIDMNQNSYGNKLAVSFPSNKQHVWRAQLSSNHYYVALVNFDFNPTSLQFSFQQVEISGSSCQAYDVWNNKDLGKVSLSQAYTTTVPGDTALLLRFASCQ